MKNFKNSLSFVSLVRLRLIWARLRVKMKIYFFSVSSTKTPTKLNVHTLHTSVKNENLILWVFLLFAVRARSLSFPRSRWVPRSFTRFRRRLFAQCWQIAEFSLLLHHHMLIYRLHNSDVQCKQHRVFWLLFAARRTEQLCWARDFVQSCQEGAYQAFFSRIENCAQYFFLYSCNAISRPICTTLSRLLNSLCVRQTMAKNAFNILFSSLHIWLESPILRIEVWKKKKREELDGFYVYFLSTHFAFFKLLLERHVTPRGRESVNNKMF